MAAGTLIQTMKQNNTANRSNRTHQANLTYRVNNNTTKYYKLTLIDRGCNGSLAGDDMHQTGISDFQRLM